jgi:hypothetical protein
MDRPGFYVERDIINGPKTPKRAANGLKVQ